MSAEQKQEAAVKPLDLSNLLKHAFISGRESVRGPGSFNAEAWVEYNPEICPAYARIAAALAPAASSQERIAQLEGALSAVKTWAEKKCPCRNEEPNPCPLCGASVENLEPCKAADRTFPHDLLRTIDAARRSSVGAAK